MRGRSLDKQLRKLGRPIVPEDLRDPSLASGFHFVTATDPSVNKPYQARKQGLGHGAGQRAFGGPRRKYGEQAAVDFCEWFNDGALASPTTLATAGHEYTVDESDKDEEYQAALGTIRDRKAQKAGRQGYVYLIVETTPTGHSDLTYGKIGYSTNPEKRVAELQTGNPRALRLLYKKPGTEADERALHIKYLGQNALQEWFRLNAGLLLEFSCDGQKYRVWAPGERKAA